MNSKQTIERSLKKPLVASLWYNATEADISIKVMRLSPRQLNKMKKV